MSDLPSVSVVIPVYRQASFIETCLDAIAAQTYAGPIEVVVVDDGSPDESAERARAHSLAATVISQENTGVAGARNTGIARSTGELVAFVDADDLWAPAKLERQVAALVKIGKPGLSFTRYRRVSASGAQIAEREHPSVELNVRPRGLVYQNFIGTSTVLVYRTCLERTGGFPTSEVLARGGQDYALWLRVAALFPLVYVPEVLTDYMVHDHNRVGIDPVRHHTAGLHALQDFEEWAPERFRPMAGASLRVVAALRTLRFVRDALKRRHHYPDRAISRAIIAARDLVL
ncbi:MAG: glycosyltransferase family 2 protein [Bradymonadaceae bacterium]